MKIGVIGAGAVGVAVCNYVLALGNCRELVLLDKNGARAEGELMDFGHASSLTFGKNIRLNAGDDYAMLENADIVVITAGAQIKADQPRIELAEVNSRICVDIARNVEQYAPNAILIVVTNPCDLAAFFIINNTGFAAHQVISSGCVVDTARLMKIVGDHTQLDPKNVFGYILGEHGSHCFMPASILGAGGQPIDFYCDNNQLPRIDPQQLLQDVKRAGYEIFKRKLNTTHGVAASVYRIIQAVSLNEHSVLPVGVLVDNHYDLFGSVLSLPSVIGRNGIEKVLEHPFTAEELTELKQIHQQIRGVIESVAKITELNC
ncbi:malate dehydrogenase [Shewanella mangrovi]|uniref:Malate dehydrogenase n=1 Tax=Shewanella mangrovi TaxID=1515746 RepID=A0A094JBK9_9GAMM|nr:malate dehydrogenase [Shewanella mangrovi]KFZ37300.1 malate dehydrogenase [Shewanella mangrovi]